MAKIDVITVKLVCHIPVDRSDAAAVLAAYDTAQGLCVAAEGLGQTTWEKRLNRVTAPPPKPKPEATEDNPTDDGLDIPENLRRAPKSAAAE